MSARKLNARDRSTIRITLENVSTLPIDMIHLTFDDSTIAPAQQALAEGELSVFDTYETEYDLVHRPVFTWDSAREPQEIGAGQKRVITVNCFGKVGWYVSSFATRIMTIMTRITAQVALYMFRMPMFDDRKIACKSLQRYSTPGNCLIPSW